MTTPTQDGCGLGFAQHKAIAFHPQSCQFCAISGGEGLVLILL
jgi:hypothetical protein